MDAELDRRLERLEDKIDQRFDRLEDTHAKTHDDLERRIRPLEKFRWQVLTLIAVAEGILYYLVSHKVIV